MDRSEATAPTEPLRWGTERRLEFIDFRLYWEGRVNRADLTREFGISVPQASLDLTRYQQLAPANMTYDKSAKTYLASPEFRPFFFKPDADAYLNSLRSISDEIVTPEANLAQPNSRRSRRCRRRDAARTRIICAQFSQRFKAMRRSIFGTSQWRVPIRPGGGFLRTRSVSMASAGMRAHCATSTGPSRTSCCPACWILGSPVQVRGVERMTAFGTRFSLSASVPIQRSRPRNGAQWNSTTE